MESRMRGNSHVRFGVGDEETCPGNGVRRFIPTLPKNRSALSLSGALRGLPAEGVGRDVGSAAGEGFPLPEFQIAVLEVSIGGLSTSNQPKPRSSEVGCSSLRAAIKARVAFLDRMQVPFGPGFEGDDDRHQVLGALGKGVFDAQGPKVKHGTGRKAIALQVSKRLGQHFLGNALKLPLKRAEAHRPVVERNEGQRGPFFAHSRKDVAGRADADKGIRDCIERLE
jgi:hypothetical protein